MFHLSEKHCREIMSRLHNDLVKGLGKDTHANSIVKCWITYIQDLPNGKGMNCIERSYTCYFILYLLSIKYWPHNINIVIVSERGKFLALDLGGTNFRVLIINLGENHFDMQSKIYAIPNHIMTGTGIALFDHIAECLANFMKVNIIFSICES